MRKERPLSDYIAAAILSASRHRENSEIRYSLTSEGVNDVFRRWYGTPIPAGLANQAIETLVSWRLVKKFYDPIVGVTYRYDCDKGGKYFDRKSSDRNDIFYYVDIHSGDLIRKVKYAWGEAQRASGGTDNQVQSAATMSFRNPPVPKPAMTPGQLDWNKIGAIAGCIGVIVAILSLFFTLHQS